MKAFTNANPQTLPEALRFVRRAKQTGRTTAFAGGGSDLLGLMKERLITPDVLVHLSTVKNLDVVKPTNASVTIGGQATLASLAENRVIREEFPVLAEAAETVATPQIRNVATLAGNICQRPWCWYYRQGFKCLKNGGTTCYSVAGENEFHAIFGGGPSYIVHPSDAAPALVALDAKFRLVSAAGERLVPAAEFFTLPTVDASRENVLKDGEMLAEVVLPRRGAGTHSRYHKVMDREAWTHAIVSAAVVLDMDKEICRSARIVLGGVAPIPWRVPEAEKVLTGKRLTSALAREAAAAAVSGARPLAKNAYKVPMTQALVARTIADCGLGLAD